MKSHSVNAFDRLCQMLRSSWPSDRWRDVTVLVAVSGGADSMALLRALAEIKRSARGRGQLILAHYNHALREKDADIDEAFVRKTAQQLNLHCETGSWQASGKESLEQKAPRDEATMRAARYGFLARTAHRFGARYVATGHTLDDNVETMLHHLFRGTGPAGLAGMPVHRELISDVLLIRPLLSIDRQLVRESLRAIGQTWRDDASNQDLSWKRNWIRHALLPLIEQQYPAASQRIGSTLASQRKLVEMLDSLADQWITSHCRLDADGGGQAQRLHIACGGTRSSQEQSAIVIHALRRLWDRLGWPRGAMRDEQWQRLWQAVTTEAAPAFALPGKLSVTREGGSVTIERSG